MQYGAIKRLYATEKAYLDFDPSVPCIIAGKFGFLSSEEFRKTMVQGLEFYKEKVKGYPGVGWIANLNQANVYDPVDIQWMIEYWNPAAIEAGLKYIAFIEPDSDFVKTSVDKYTKQSVIRGGMVISNFHDIGLAKTWLRSQLFDHFG